MQLFKDSVTAQIYEYDDDVVVTEDAGIYAFATADGNNIVVPLTLQPYSFTDPDLLAQAKSDRLIQLENEYSAAVVGDVTYNGNIYQADAQAQTNLNNVMTAYSGNALPVNFYWVTKDNTPISFDLQDLEALAKIIADRSWAAFEQLQTAKDNVRNATDVTSVGEVTF